MVEIKVLAENIILDLDKHKQIIEQQIEKDAKKWNRVTRKQAFCGNK